MTTETYSTVLDNYHQIEKQFFSAVSQTSRTLQDNVEFYYTGVDICGLNVLFVKQKIVHLESVLTEGIQFLEHSGSPFCVVLHHDVVDEAKGILSKLSFHSFEISTAMYLDLDTFVPQEAEGGLIVRCSDDNLDDWALPISSAFGVEPGSDTMPQYQERHQLALDAQKPVTHFTLYKNGQPVSSLTLTIHHGCARLDDIGTMAEHQRNGYGTVLIYHVLAHLKSQGVFQCFLEASCDSLALYQKIGFVSLFEYTIFYCE